MSLVKVINIDGKDVKFKASAAIPRIYRVEFGRDIFKDLMSLESVTKNNNKNASNLDVFSLELFENIAYVMAKHADKSVADTPEEWLDQFGTFSIYEILPELIDLWGLNLKTKESSQKKFKKRQGK